MDFFISNNANVNTLFCGTPKSVEKSEHNLGGNLYFGDPATFCPNVFQYVMRRFGVKSVLDVGSGLGYLPLFLNQTYNVPVIGLEGLPFNVESAVYPLVQWDLTQGAFKATPVDLVTCVEVVEHIEEKYLDNLLDTLTQGKIILMTHALPGTHGDFHVNEQNDQYWVDKLASRGYGLLLADSQLVRRLDAQESRGPGYFAQSGLVFGRLPRGTLTTSAHRHEDKSEAQNQQSEPKQESESKQPE